MQVIERVDSLKNLMKKENIKAYVIPSADFHQSEYVADFFKSREWISGFTGSAGLVVISEYGNGLWTDGRYFIQAENQLKGSSINLFKMNTPGYPSYIQWLKENLNENDTIALDGRCFTIAQINELKKELKNINIKVDLDLIAELWENRPLIQGEDLYVHEEKYCGLSFKEKNDKISDFIEENNSKWYLLSSLDEIAWYLNLRGDQIPNNPFFYAYCLTSKDKTILFTDIEKINKNVKKYLDENSIELKPYHEIYFFLSSFDEKVILVKSKNNFATYALIRNKDNITFTDSIITKLKAIKNEVEIQNQKQSHIDDSVAMVKFIYWLKNNVGKEKITEISASEKLTHFRAQIKDFKGTSFDSIAGYKEHAAMMHYKATPESDYELKSNGFFLIDSGGQYLRGTTDITRTIALGDLTHEEKTDFTLVLKGHINLARAKFLEGTKGYNLDILARQPLWQRAIDYKCGTGHGVGFLGGVHEGPQSLSQKNIDVELKEGMVLTNEPGIYKEGKHGIRIENTMLVKEFIETEFGTFFEFETISYCPIDLDAVDKTLLSPEEIKWLNEYHEMTFELLEDKLNEEERNWLKEYTKAI